MSLWRGEMSIALDICYWALGVRVTECPKMSHFFVKLSKYCYIHKVLYFQDLWISGERLLNRCDTLLRPAIFCDHKSIECNMLNNVTKFR